MCELHGSKHTHYAFINLLYLRFKRLVIVYSIQFYVLLCIRYYFAMDLPFIQEILSNVYRFNEVGVVH